MSLRAHVVRLASSLPKGDPVRREILAVLTQTAAMKWTNTVAGERVRIRWTDHPANTLLIEELPAKGKKRLRRGTYSASQVFGSVIHMPDAFLVDNIVRDMKPSPSMSYESAVAALKHGLAEAVAYVDSGKDSRKRSLADWERTQISRQPYQDEVFYLEVEPADYSPMMVQGKDFKMKVEWGEFEAFSPNSDFQQADPHYSVIEQSAPASARKLYKMLKADPDALRSIGWYGLRDWLNSNGIKSETHHSQWH